MSPFFFKLARHVADYQPILYVLTSVSRFSRSEINNVDFVNFKLELIERVSEKFPDTLIFCFGWVLSV